MDGYSATREIRRLEGRVRHAPIVAMAAEALAGCQEQCLAAGMDDYIAKPIKCEMLFEALRKWAPGRAGGSAPGVPEVLRPRVC